MRRLEIFMLLCGALIPLAAVGGFVGGAGISFMTRPTSKPILQPIERTTALSVLESHFNLGTDSQGKPAYNHTACGGSVCAWLYQRGNWRVVLYIAQPAGSTPRGPRDERQN